MRGDGVRVARGDDEIEIVHRFLAAAVAPGEAGLQDLRVLAQMLQEGLGQRGDIAEQMGAGMLGAAGDGGGNFGGGFFAEAGQPGHRAAGAGGFQFHDAGDFELLVEGL